MVVEERGEPVEQLTVEWEIYRQDPQTYTVEVEVSVEERPDYLARLAATAVVVGAAVEISGELLAEDIRASLTADFSKIDVATRPAGVESKVDVDIRAGAPAPRVEPAPLLQPPPVQQIPTIQPTIRP